MQPRGFKAERRGGLDRQHLPTALGEPVRIPAAAGPDVEHQSGLARQERQGASVDLLEAEGFVSGSELAETPVVRADGVPGHAVWQASITEMSVESGPIPPEGAVPQRWMRIRHFSPRGACKARTAC